MKYRFVNAESQMSMLEQRLQQLEQEHYSHTINKKTALELAKLEGREDEAASLIRQSEQAIEIIENAAKIVTEELDGFKAKKTSK